ncbi:GNAT family N-acetyltransferase [Glycomyces fuscus]|nr:GNAT family N-acetyltransferase [Glycomyces fuscus]
MLAPRRHATERVFRVRRTTPHAITRTVRTADAGELLGFAAGHLLFPVEDDAPAAQLIALVTAEGARGRGVGTALCAAFETWAVERGAARAMLNSSTWRTEAHAFYTRRGYAASGARFSKSL